jgi:NAD(P)-dependent dehydrogenase (short-subunit alcohol dehydrogenase family)
LNLLNKNILLTGASRGLGNKLAKNLWAQGANLFLVSRTKNDQLQDYFLDNRVGIEQRFVWYKGDLSVENNLQQIYLNFDCMFSGKIDVLINNAAIQQPIGLFWDNDEEEWKKCLDINLFAPSKLMRHFIPYMLIKNYGRIINLAGGGATSSRPCFSAYAVAKTGLVRLTEVIADELFDSGITANCISPGAMSTFMMQEIIDCNQSPKKEKEKAIDIIKMDDFTMDNAINLINWLISEESNGVTGRLISAQWDDYKTIYKDRADTDLHKLRRKID